MSDVGVAPAPAAAPAASEVPINPNPTSIPQPVGPQAPSKPVGEDHKGSEHRPESRREVIQKAFQRAQEDRPKPEPAKAKMGHNQPPEPMEKERPKPKPEPIDLKKRPDDQPKPRGDHGHFAPREGQERAVQQDPKLRANNQQQQPAQYKRLPEGAPYSNPLPRMAEHAKAAWADTPEPVRGEVHRMAHEFERAYQQYRGDHEEMNRIRPFHDMAREHGTTLDRALQNYVGMEHKLRNDVVGGLDLIVNNLNLQTPDGRKLGLMDVAWHIVNQTPEQHQLLQSKNRAMAQSHQLQAAQQRIEALESFTRRMQYGAAFQQTRGAVDQYAASHPRLDELADLIENEVKLGFDLDTAYRRAELLRPATHAAQTRSPTAQTRTSDRSISGAPDGGPSNGTRQRAGKPVGRREAIAAAMKRANGSL